MNHPPSRAQEREGEKKETKEDLLPLRREERWTKRAKVCLNVRFV